jgi:hypothetical protein
MAENDHETNPHVEVHGPFACGRTPPKNQKFFVPLSKKLDQNRRKKISRFSFKRFFASKNPHLYCMITEICARPRVTRPPSRGRPLFFLRCDRPVVQVRSHAEFFFRLREKIIYFRTTCFRKYFEMRALFSSYFERKNEKF